MHLPRGFHQSAILASLVFDRSLLGSLIRSKQIKSLISVYNDDIIISSFFIELLRKDFSAIISASEQSNFKINTRKTQPPCERVEAFNLWLSHQEISFTERRMEKFLVDMSSLKKWCDSSEQDYFSESVHLHADYISSISRRQLQETMRRISE